MFSAPSPPLPLDKHSLIKNKILLFGQKKNSSHMPKLKLIFSPRAYKLIYYHSKWLIKKSWSRSYRNPPKKKKPWLEHWSWNAFIEEASRGIKLKSLSFFMWNSKILTTLILYLSGHILSLFLIRSVLYFQHFVTMDLN